MRRILRRITGVRDQEDALAARRPGSSSDLFVGPLNVAIDIGLDFRVCRANNYAAARRRPRSATPSPRSPLWAGARCSETEKHSILQRPQLFCEISTLRRGAEHDARRSDRRQPPLRAGQRARADARTYYTDATADAAADHDGPPRR